MSVLLKRILPSLFMLTCSCIYAKQSDTSLQRLNQVMNNKERYVAIKNQNIEKIKQLLTVKNLLPMQQYDIHQKLHDEYLKYCTDSAIVYMNKNSAIAIRLNDRDGKFTGCMTAVVYPII